VKDKVERKEKWEGKRDASVMWREKRYIGTCEMDLP
jgi:hypothetical protein